MNRTATTLDVIRPTTDCICCAGFGLAEIFEPGDIATCATRSRHSVNVVQRDDCDQMISGRMLGYCGSDWWPVAKRVIARQANWPDEWAGRAVEIADSKTGKVVFHMEERPK